jgi:hypothetical protein
MAHQGEMSYLGTCSRGRIRKAGVWLFLLPVFSEGVFPGVVKLQVGGTAVLAFVSIVILRDDFPRSAFWRIYSVFTILTFTVIGYVTFGSWPTQGTASAYDIRAIMFVIMYLAVAVFAVFFFNLSEFEKVLRRIATIALSIAIVTCLASRITGHIFLANPADNGLRMVGTVTEPSEWAPILSVVLLLGIRHRSRLNIALSSVGFFLSDSPTCILVMAVSCFLYYLLSSRWRGRTVTIILLTVLTPLTVLAIRDVNTTKLTASNNPALVAAGRLVSGIRNVETGGQVGQNMRYVSVVQVTSTARDNGWMTTGAGPGADTVYFNAIHVFNGPLVAANAMWLSILFDFGIWGVAAFAIMLLVGIWRMQRNSLALAIFLPFFTASMVNSAVPDYSVTALGILLFTFGWISRSYPRTISR